MGLTAGLAGSYLIIDRDGGVYWFFGDEYSVPGTEYKARETPFSDTKLLSGSVPTIGLGISAPIRFRYCVSLRSQDRDHRRSRISIASALESRLFFLFLRLLV